MSQQSEHDRIAHKAHEIWESEGRPHGRDQAHWDQAKEIVALHDSMGDTLLPRETGVDEPGESLRTAGVNGDMPGMTDQGRDDLNDIDREPEVTKPGKGTAASGAPAPADKPLKGDAAAASKTADKAPREVEARPLAPTKTDAKPEAKATAVKAANVKAPPAKAPVSKAPTPKAPNAKAQPNAGKR